MKKKIIITIVVATVVFIISGIFYYRYTSSPEYSLAQIRIAYEEHDITKFEKFVDTKTLVGGVLDKTLSEYTNNSTSSSSAEKLGENLGKGFINLMRPQLEELWSKQINNLIETGDILGEGNKKGLDELWNKNGTVSFSGIKEIKKEGKVATISIEFNQPRFDTTLAIDVKMRDKGGYWQLFDISNIIEYGKTIELLEERRVYRLNEEVKKLFFQNIKISEIKLKTEIKGSYYTKWYQHTYTIEFENIGNKEIKRLACFFDIVNSKGKKLGTAYVSEALNLGKGAKYLHKEQDTFSYEQIDPLDLSIKLDLVNLDFTDGTGLSWQSKWGNFIKVDDL